MRKGGALAVMDELILAWGKSVRYMYSPIPSLRDNWGS
jgi:hypothetical protein